MSKDICSTFCPFWIIKIVTGLGVHLNQINMTGLLYENKANFNEPTVSSAIFCLALCIFLAEFCWWPCSLTRPHNLIFRFYQTVVISFLVDFVMQSIYLSTQNGFKWIFSYLALRFKKQEKTINNPDVQAVFLIIVSISFFYLVLYVTNRFNDIINFFKFPGKNQSQVNNNLNITNEEVIKTQKIEKVKCSCPKCRKRY